MPVDGASPCIVTIASTIPTMKYSGPIPMNEARYIITVIVSAPVVPAYPGSAHNLFPK